MWGFLVKNANKKPRIHQIMNRGFDVIFYMLTNTCV